MKRLVAFCLAMVLLVAAVPVGQAEKVDVQTSMRELADRVFAQCLANSGRLTFQGHCGNYVSHQMVALGINAWRSSRNGNEYFDHYSTMRKTSGGYYPKAFSALEYGLEDGLNFITENGTKDVRNVMIGFQWTNTEAGAKYGHVVMIYGIYDGVVYFSESYPIYLKRAHKEGELVTCSIAEFARYYGAWTEYEGLVIFGGKTFLDSCKMLGTNLILQTRFDSYLRSEPCAVGENYCQRLRQVGAGERLHAIAVLKNPKGQQFYRLADGTYIAANAVGAVRFNGEDMYIDDLVIPTTAAVGEEIELSGTVKNRYARAATLSVSVEDSQGNMMFFEEMQCEGFDFPLGALNRQIQFKSLPEGIYSVKVFGEVACPTAEGVTRYGRACLGGSYLVVGDVSVRGELGKIDPYVERLENGWHYDDGWMYYQNDRFQVGWVNSCGVDYYLNRVGKILTGWNYVGGELRYFTDTGAMVKNTQMYLEDVCYDIDDAGIATAVVEETAEE